MLWGVLIAYHTLLRRWMRDPARPIEPQRISFHRQLRHRELLAVPSVRSG